MTITPEDLCRIPGSGESVDPCGNNPFPPDDARHQVWADATRLAEEELSRLKVELLSRRCGSPTQMMDFIIAANKGRFHIWAKRGVHVVWGDFNIPPYDTWLLRYAEATLKTASEHCPAYISREGLLTELRLQLMREVEYCKAEARRHVSQQPPEMSQGDQPKLGPEGASDAPPATERKGNDTVMDNGGANSGTDRRKAVDAYIEEVFSRTRKRITRTDIWKAAKYRSRTEFERWERNDPDRPNRAAHAAFTRILTDKPHLK
jgi:hypothetical protein